MKRFSYGILVLMLSVLSFACQTEEIAPQAEIQNQKNALPILCGLGGDTFELEAGRPYNFTLRTSLSNATVNWSVTGNISIEFGQGTSEVTVITHSDFAGGTITVQASGKDVNGDFQSCTRTKNLTTSGSCTPPSSLSIAQDFSYGGCPGEVFRFTATPDETDGGGSYSWSVSGNSSIISGQGTNAIRVQSPMIEGFSVSASYTSNCQNVTVNDFTIAQFSSNCN